MRLRAVRQLCDGGGHFLERVVRIVGVEQRQREVDAGQRQGRIDFQGRAEGVGSLVVIELLEEGDRRRCWRDRRSHDRRERRRPAGSAESPAASSAAAAHTPNARRIIVRSQRLAWSWSHPLPSRMAIDCPAEAPASFSTRPFGHVTSIEVSRVARPSPKSAAARSASSSSIRSSPSPTLAGRRPSGRGRARRSPSRFDADPSRRQRGPIGRVGAVVAQQPRRAVVGGDQRDRDRRRCRSRRRRRRAPTIGRSNAAPELAARRPRTSCRRGCGTGAAAARR